VAGSTEYVDSWTSKCFKFEVCRGRRIERWLKKLAFNVESQARFETCSWKDEFPKYLKTTNLSNWSA